MSNQQQRNRREGIRNTSNASNDNLFTLRRGVRDFAVVVIIMNVLNILAYNTGWISWQNDTFDIIWGTSLCVLSLSVITMFQLLDR